MLEAENTERNLLKLLVTEKYFANEYVVKKDSITDESLIKQLNKI